MLDAVRRLVEAGREALTPEKAEELARTLVKEGQARLDQMARLARDLSAWSRRNSDRLMASIRAEVKAQIPKAGLATKGEMEALKRRVRKLESASRAPAKRASAAKPRKKAAAGKKGASNRA
jgi:polyhydroxyalkanoate synthesis regulator phasin